MKLFGNKKDAKNLENSKKRSYGARSVGKSAAEKPRRGINWTPEEEALVRGNNPAPAAKASGGRRETPKTTAAPAASSQGRRSAQKKKKGLGRGIKTLIVVIVVIIAILLAAFAVIKVAVRPPDVPEPSTDPGASDVGTEPGKTGVEQVPGKDPDTGADITYEVEVPATVNKNIYNILVVGMDRVGANTDTMIIMSYNAEAKTLSALSLPRDTMVNINAYYNYKLNSVYASGGVDSLVSTIEGIVGFPIDFHISVDLKAFAEVINAIGGIDYEVPFRMYYVDSAQNLTIDFQPGMQNLNGEECSNLLRWRQNNSGVYDAEAKQYSDLGDIGRIQLQQRFLSEVLSQMIQLQNITKIGEIAKIMKEYVDTNLTTGELAWLGMSILSDVSISDINFMTLPGEGIYFQNLSYYEIHPDALLDLLNDYFNPYTNASIEMNDLNIIGVKDGQVVSYTGDNVLTPGGESVPTGGSDEDDGDSDVSGSTGDSGGTGNSGSSGGTVSYILPDGSVVTTGPGGVTIITPGSTAPSPEPAPAPGNAGTTPTE